MGFIELLINIAVDGAILWYFVRRGITYGENKIKQMLSPEQIALLEAGAPLNTLPMSSHERNKQRVTDALKQHSKSVEELYAELDIPPAEFHPAMNALIQEGIVSVNPTTNRLELREDLRKPL